MAGLPDYLVGARVVLLIRRRVGVFAGRRGTIIATMGTEALIQMDPQPGAPLGAKMRLSWRWWVEL